MNEQTTSLNRGLKRDQIIQAAFELFRENGFYATGVDLIMRTAKVSKRTLYKYFPTKNELIISVLEYYRSEYKKHLTDLLDRSDQSGRKKILSIFEDAEKWFGDTQFHGCLAVNAMAEFSGKDAAIEDSCQCFKRWELGMLERLAREAGARESKQLAFKLFILLEGMASIAQVSNGKSPVDITQMADRLVGEYVD